MSEYTDGHYDGPSEGRRTPTLETGESEEETRFMDEDGGNQEPVTSSRTMPVPEYMQRRRDRHQGAAGDDDDAPPSYQEPAPPSYLEATSAGATSETDASANADDAELSPEEIAVVLKMQSDRDQYMPESRASYAEAIEMISPEENGEVKDAPDALAWREQPRVPPREPERDSVIVAQSSPHYLERGRAPERRQDFECTSCWVLNTPITWLGQYLQGQSNTRLLLIGVLAIAVIGVILFVSLFPASFVYIEYYQVALPQSKMTNKVDRETVYYPGCYVLGPDTTLVRFTASAHTIVQDIRVFTTDTIAIRIRYSLIYFLRQKEVGQLYTKFLHDYDEPFGLIVSSSIRNLAATSYSVDQFRFNRTFVEREMHAMLRKRLGGDCCPECCPKDCQSNLYCENCKKGTCDQGYHVDARHFNLLSVTIPNAVFEMYLRFAILEIEKEKEFFLQDHALIQKETSLQTQRFKNDANEIKANGTYEAVKIATIADAEKEKIVQTSYVTALKDFFTTLRVSGQEYKSSLMMIRAMEDRIGNLRTGYGFNQSTLFAH